jgi:hypothetical protein
MSTSLTSYPRLAAFVLSEASGQRSRENVPVTRHSTQPIKSGTVLKVSGGKYVPYDGSGDAAGILYNHVEPGTGDVEAVAFVRDCEVNVNALIGLDSGAVADLLSLGILVRGSTDSLSIHTPAL